MHKVLDSGMHRSIPLIIAIFYLSILGGLGCHRHPKGAVPVPPPPVQPPPPSRHRESIYFLKGDASLSPGAHAKLRTWTEAWGTQGAWTLGCPRDAQGGYDLLWRRILVLRAELTGLGVQSPGSRLEAPEVDGPYDPIYIEMDPRGARAGLDLPRRPWMAKSCLPPVKARTAARRKAKPAPARPAKPAPTKPAKTSL